MSPANVIADNYARPYEFFIEAIPKYVCEHGPYINVKRLFNGIFGRPIGVYTTHYMTEIEGIHINSLVRALVLLAEEGKVRKRSKVRWIWIGHREGTTNGR